MEAYFKTKFHDLFEITKRKDSKIHKQTFRNIFIRWLLDKKLLPKKLTNLTPDDKMLIQRLLTVYIKDNYNDQCTFQGKHYTGMIFKLPNKIWYPEEKMSELPRIRNLEPTYIQGGSSFQMICMHYNFLPKFNSNYIWVRFYDKKIQFFI